MCACVCVCECEGGGEGDYENNVNDLINCCPSNYVSNKLVNYHLSHFMFKYIAK